MAAISAFRVTQHGRFFHLSLEIEFNALSIIQFPGSVQLTLRLLWTKMFLKNQGPNYFYQAIVLFLCVSNSVYYVAVGLSLEVQFRIATRP